MIEIRDFYINGQWQPPLDGGTHMVIDPATERPFAEISLGGQADTDAAVAAAKAAFPAWSAISAGERVALVKGILAQYEARAEEMAQAISQEMGAPITLARDAQAPCLAEHVNDFLEAFEAFSFLEPLRADTPGAMIAREPVGVVGLITPWNWPMNQIALKVIPALLTGCTVVLKPSEQAPLSARLFAEFVHDAGCPAGVFNLVYGDGQGVGTQLSTHADVAMISFTGSTRAGRAISHAAADTFKRVTLELGGKGANLIFADADDGAIARGVMQCFENTGQSCNAPTRMLVEAQVYDQAVTIAAELCARITVDHPMREGPHLGPVVNATQWQHIQALIQSGIDDGARLVAGGLGRPAGFESGYYVRPTIFADVTPDMRIAREEIFGPVLVMIPFETEDEALRIANDTPYGLTNYVQSADRARCNRLARGLRSGMVEMNGQPPGAGAPFGGIGASGRAREGGAWGLEEFLDVKSISGWSEI